MVFFYLAVFFLSCQSQEIKKNLILLEIGHQFTPMNLLIVISSVTYLMIKYIT